MSTINLPDEATQDTLVKKHQLPRRIVRAIFRRPRVAVVIVLVIVVATGVYVYTHRQTPQEKAAAQVAAAVAGLEKHMIVPAGTPVLATVQDAKALKAQQPFFSNAQNGDQLLIFPESRQAVLYSPSRGVIVNVGPIEYPNNTTPTKNNTLPATAATPPTTSASSPVTVEVRNGSGKNGLGASVAETLKKNATYLVVTTTDAKSKGYASTIVVDVAKKTDEHDAINALAKTLGGSVVSELPKGESATTADVVVILGSGLTP